MIALCKAGALLVYLTEWLETETELVLLCYSDLDPSSDKTSKECFDTRVKKKKKKHSCYTENVVKETHMLSSTSSASMSACPAHSTQRILRLSFRGLSMHGAWKKGRFCGTNLIIRGSSMQCLGYSGRWVTRLS